MPAEGTLRVNRESVPPQWEEWLPPPFWETAGRRALVGAFGAGISGLLERDGWVPIDPDDPRYGMLLRYDAIRGTQQETEFHLANTPLDDPEMWFSAEFIASGEVPPEHLLYESQWETLGWTRPDWWPEETPPPMKNVIVGQYPVYRDPETGADSSNPAHQFSRYENIRGNVFDVDEFNKVKKALGIGDTTEILLSGAEAEAVWREQGGTGVFPGGSVRVEFNPDFIPPEYGYTARVQSFIDQPRTGRMAQLSGEEQRLLRTGSQEQLLEAGLMVELAEGRPPTVRNFNWIQPLSSGQQSQTLKQQMADAYAAGDFEKAAQIARDMAILESISAPTEAPGAFEAERRLVEARRATEVAQKTRSAEEQFDAALDAGDLDKARMVRNFLDEPSEWQVLQLMMQYADNPAALRVLFDYVDAIGRADVVPEDARAFTDGSTIYNPQTRQFEPFSQLGRPGEAPSALGQLKEIDPARAEAAQRIVDPGAFTFGAPPFLGGAALPGEAPEEASERMFSRAMQESARTGGLGREGARFAAEEDILDPGYFSRRIPGVTPTAVRAREQEAAALGRPVTAPVPVGPEEPATRRPVPQVTPEEFRAQEAQAAALGRPVAALPPERIPTVMPETFRDREAEAAALGRMVMGPPADRFAPEEEVRRRREAFMAQFREDALAQAAAGYQATPATFQPRGEGEIVGSYFNTIPIEDQLRYHKLVETPTGMRSEYEPQFRGTPSRGGAQLVNPQGDVLYVNAADEASMKHYLDKGYTVRSLGPPLPEPDATPSAREGRFAEFKEKAQAFAPKKKTPKPFGTPRFVTS